MRNFLLAVPTFSGLAQSWEEAAWIVVPRLVAARVPASFKNVRRVVLNTDSLRCVQWKAIIRIWSLSRAVQLIRKRGERFKNR